jgi:hypothetical protein
VPRACQTQLSRVGIHRAVTVTPTGSLNWALARDLGIRSSPELRGMQEVASMGAMGALS